MPILGAALIAAVAGALAGRGLRAVLGRMRRGAVVGPGRCEAAVAGAWTVPVVVAAAGWAEPAWLPVWLGLGLLGVAGTATDLAHRRLPDSLTLPAAPVALALLTPLGPGAVGRGLLGAVVLFAAHAAVHLVAPAALGAGDVKLAAGLGAPLAAASWWALAAVPVLAALALAVTAAVRRARQAPLGPAMLGAAWLATAAGAVTVIG